MKKFFSLLAAAVISICAFADRAVVPTAADVATFDPTTNVVLCVYFDGSVCNDLVAIGSFNGWSDVTGPSSTLLKLRPVAGFSGWYAVAIPYAADVMGKVCQLTDDGSFTWGTQAQNWSQAGVLNKTMTFNSDGNCCFAEAGLYTYYAEFQGDACAAKTVTIKVYAPDCEYVVPTIAGDFNSWGNNSDADTDMDMDADEQGNIFYYKTIVNGVGGYKLRGGYGWGNNIQAYNAEEDSWYNVFGANVPLPQADTTYDFRNPDLYRYESCEEPVECDSANYTITVTFPVCEGTTPAIAGTFNNWAFAPMTANGNVYTITVKALCSDKFKFGDANTPDWANEMIDATGKGIADMKFGEETTITLDYSADYLWKACTQTALEEVVAAPKAVKVIENGNLFIIREGRRFNAMGMEVK